MPHVPILGSFPLTLRDYNVMDPRRGELLINYANNELFFVKKEDGSIVSMARDIYDRIMASRVQNNEIVIYDVDKISPPPGKKDLVLPPKDRKYNGMYLMVTSRKKYDPGEYNPLTAQAWAVKSGIKFLGKNSGYNPYGDKEE